MQRLRKRGARVARACHAHCLVYIAAPRKRVSNRPAEACGGAPERLYFRGVVVGFVLEHHKPLLVLPVDVHVYDYARGVDFLADFEVFKLPLRAQPAHSYQRHVHQAHRLALCVEPKNLARFKVRFP